MANDARIAKVVSDHLPNAEMIIRTLIKLQINRSAKKDRPRYLDLAYIREYQRHIFEKFGEVITKPSIGDISKTDDGWLIVGDTRNEIANMISVIIERFGLGVGMLVLHAQQMNAGHIPLTININGRAIDLTLPTQSLYGARGEHVINVPIRKFRSDNAKLAELNIIKPPGLWDRSQIIQHKGDKFECRYCSAGEMNPCEVVVNIQGSRFGLSRNYSFGFTFAPFGNPLKVIHFLAWDQAEKPLNMNRTPMTVSDLIVLTRLINTAIRDFFTGTGIKDFPVIDGISNGWAGNSIYHQHFQFFQPEFPTPIESDNLVHRRPTLEREDVKIHRLSWALPVYKIIADESINVGLVGNDLAGIWRLLSDVEIINPESNQDSPDGFEPEAGTEMRFHTQNLYVPGQYLGKIAYILLRDRRLVDFKPGNKLFVDKRHARKTQEKSNIGVLEATGTMIADDLASFAEMSSWESDEVTTQIEQMAQAVCPKEKKVDDFEKAIRGLFPPE